MACRGLTPILGPADSIDEILRKHAISQAIPLDRSSEIEVRLNLPIEFEMRPTSAGLGN